MGLLWTSETVKRIQSSNQTKTSSGSSSSGSSSSGSAKSSTQPTTPSAPPSSSSSSSSSSSTTPTKEQEQPKPTPEYPKPQIRKDDYGRILNPNEIPYEQLKSKHIAIDAGGKVVGVFSTPDEAKRFTEKTGFRYYGTVEYYAENNPKQSGIYTMVNPRTGAIYDKQFASREEAITYARQQGYKIEGIDEDFRYGRTATTSYIEQRLGAGDEVAKKESSIIASYLQSQKTPLTPETFEQTKQMFRFGNANYEMTEALLNPKKPFIQPSPFTSPSTSASFAPKGTSPLSSPLDNIMQSFNQPVNPFKTPEEKVTKIPETQKAELPKPESPFASTYDKIFGSMPTPQEAMEGKYQKVITIKEERPKETIFKGEVIVSPEAIYSLEQSYLVAQEIARNTVSREQALSFLENTPKSKFYQYFPKADYNITKSILEGKTAEEITQNFPATVLVKDESGKIVYSEETKIKDIKQSEEKINAFLKEYATKIQEEKRKQTISEIEKQASDLFEEPVKFTEYYGVPFFVPENRKEEVFKELHKLPLVSTNLSETGIGYQVGEKIIPVSYSSFAVSEGIGLVPLEIAHKPEMMQITYKKQEEKINELKNEITASFKSLYSEEEIRKRVKENIPYKTLTEFVKSPDFEKDVIEITTTLPVQTKKGPVNVSVSTKYRKEQIIDIITEDQKSFGEIFKGSPYDWDYFTNYITVETSKLLKKRQEETGSLFIPSLSEIGFKTNLKNEIKFDLQESAGYKMTRGGIIGFGAILAKTEPEKIIYQVPVAGTIIGDALKNAYIGIAKGGLNVFSKKEHNIVDFYTNITPPVFFTWLETGSYISIAGTGITKTIGAGKFVLETAKKEGLKATAIASASKSATALKTLHDITTFPVISTLAKTGASTIASSGLKIGKTQISKIGVWGIKATEYMAKAERGLYTLGNIEIAKYGAERLLGKEDAKMSFLGEGRAYGYASTIKPFLNPSSSYLERRQEIESFTIYNVPYYALIGASSFVKPQIARTALMTGYVGLNTLALGGLTYKFTKETGSFAKGLMASTANLAVYDIWLESYGPDVVFESAPFIGHASRVAREQKLGIHGKFDFLKTPDLSTFKLQEIKAEPSKSKIKSETGKPIVRPSYKLSLKTDLKGIKEDYKPDLKTDFKIDYKTDYKSDFAKMTLKTDYKPSLKTDYKPSIKTDYKPTTKTDYRPTLKVDYKPDFTPDYKIDIKGDFKFDFKPDFKPDIEFKPDYKPDYKPDFKFDAPLEGDIPFIPIIPPSGGGGKQGKEKSAKAVEGKLKSILEAL